MNKKAQWKIGVGIALVLGGVYILTRGEGWNIVVGIAVIATGAWLTFK